MTSVRFPHLTSVVCADTSHLVLMYTLHGQIYEQILSWKSSKIQIQIPLTAYSKMLHETYWSTLWNAWLLKRKGNYLIILKNGLLNFNYLSFWWVLGKVVNYWIYWSCNIVIIVFLCIVTFTVKWFFFSRFSLSWCFFFLLCLFSLSIKAQDLVLWKRLKKI